MFVPDLESVGVGHGVVYGPGSGGDPVAQQHINTVVATPQEKSRYPEQEQEETEPTEEREAFRAVWIMKT